MVAIVVAIWGDSQHFKHLAGVVVSVAGSGHIIVTTLIPGLGKGDTRSCIF